MAKKILEKRFSNGKPNPGEARGFLKFKASEKPISGDSNFSGLCLAILIVPILLFFVFIMHNC